MKRTLAILGATSWIGQQLCARLVADGWDVYAVSRPSNAFLLEGIGVKILSEETYPSVKEFKTVVNLAFPAMVQAGDEEGANRRILHRILGLAASDARIIHVSTVAVFGMPIVVPVQKRIIPPRPDTQYVSSKIQIENWLFGSKCQRRIDIVRLGNVWGPASDNWVIGIVERLRHGQALGVRGVDGVSNITDIANVVDYLCFLIEAQDCSKSLRQIHHLAEFSNVRWSKYVSFLSQQIQIPYELSEVVPRNAESAAAEVQSLLKVAFLKDIQEGIRNARFAGSHYRRLRQWCPKWIFNSGSKLKNSVSTATFRTRDPLGSTDDVLQILANQVEFNLSVDPIWTPPVSLEESFSRVSRWLEHCGYIAK